VRSIEACLKPMLGGYPILPVVSSGQTGLQAPETYRRDFRRSTCSILPVEGSWRIHPALRPALLRFARLGAAVKNVTLEEYAKDRYELREQIEKFGKS